MASLNELDSITRLEKRKKFQQRESLQCVLLPSSLNSVRDPPKHTDRFLGILDLKYIRTGTGKKG